MIESTELLRSYAEGIRRLSGAGSVALYVPPSLSGFSQSSLIHDGEMAPVAELADLESAQSFAAAANPPDDVVASVTPGGGLVALPAVHSAWALAVLPEQLVTDSPGRRRTDAGEEEGEPLPSAWLGLRFADDEGSIAHRLDTLDLPAALADAGERPTWWRWLFAMGGALASHTAQVSAILKDPITGLPDRAGFQAVLAEELEKARLRRRAVSLILVNPDDFAAINQRFGRLAGDEIVCEISSRLRSALRGSDPLSRYGGVIFAITLPDTRLDGARRVAEKLIRTATEGAFLDGAVRLGFSAGVAVFEPDDPEIQHHLDLIRRADQALNAAKRVGGGVVVDWEQRSGAEETGNFDRLSGIFTGNMAKDYRNMVLLWDTIDVIAVNQEFDRLAAEVVEKLYGTFKPDRVALFTRDGEGSFELRRGLTRSDSDAGPQVRVETVSLGAREQELIRLAVAAGKPRELAVEADDGGGQGSSYAVPLIATDECLGCLFIAGRESSLVLEASDLIFLRALASQLAVALDRARLAELEQRRQEVERRKLRAELNELRQALQQAKLVYRSQEMDALLATARRVAPTDATILITGESGTGKELLARTIHELSPRNDQPMVVVDCGAIPSTLIESELFGHERGAYTGAQQRRHGRIAEANRGSVLLDEIAELPLETQSKLLRFVQEKQFTTLGGNRARRVDVRIIAATNRDLGGEVREGRFREDLYYRLNVVRLEIPPLRDRPDDILHLARHFLETFSVQYQKSIRSLNPAAEDQLLRYGWPGNVRELQNRMMQAVILCESQELGPEQLSLPAEPVGAVSATAAAPRVPVSAPRGSEPVPLRPQPATLVEQFDELRRALGRQIDATGKMPGRLNFPLGRWLGDDLILEAAEAGGGVARRGAAIAGIPETTFRRRLQKSSEQNEAGLATRSGTWDEVRQILAMLVRRDDLDGEQLLARAERSLLDEIVTRFPGDVRTGSALLGVTPPTFRRRVAVLQEEKTGS